MHFVLNWSYGEGIFQYKHYRLPPQRYSHGRKTTSGYKRILQSFNITSQLVIVVASQIAYAVHFRTQLFYVCFAI